MQKQVKIRSISIWRDLFVVVSSFVVAFGTVSKLSKQQTDTHVSLKLGIFLASLGSVFFVTVTNLLNKILLCTLSGLEFVKHFKLSLSDCVDISNKLVSALQSILSCVFGVFVCRYSCRRNFLTTSHIFSESYAWFGSAYFFYDLWSMYKVYNSRIYDKLNLKSMSPEEDHYTKIPSTHTGELSFFTPINVANQKIPSFWNYIKIQKLMVFHHMFIGTYGLVVISSWRGGLGDCVFSFMFLMEMSTPFVSFRAVLSIMNLKSSKIYVANGLMMILTFLIFRILMLPTLLYYYSNVVNLSFIQAIMKLPLGCKLSIVALFIPQFYWFYLMLKAAMRMFQPSRSSNNEINHNNKSE